MTLLDLAAACIKLLLGHPCRFVCGGWVGSLRVFYIWVGDSLRVPVLGLADALSFSTNSQNGSLHCIYPTFFMPFVHGGGGRAHVTGRPAFRKQRRLRWCVRRGVVG